jgi:hypothetical protein
MLGTKAKTIRAEQPAALWRIASARMPTTWGWFDVIGFERDSSNGTTRVETALAIVLGDLTEGVPLLRIHSQCVTGNCSGCCAVIARPTGNGHGGHRERRSRARDL